MVAPSLYVLRGRGARPFCLSPYPPSLPPWFLKVWVAAGVVTLANDWSGRESWRVTLAGFLPLIVHEKRLTTHTSERCQEEGSCGAAPRRVRPRDSAVYPSLPSLTLSSATFAPFPATRPDPLGLFIYSSNPNTRSTIIPGRLHGGDECPPAEGVDCVSAAYDRGMYTRPSVEQSGAVMTPASAAPGHTRKSGRNAS